MEEQWVSVVICFRGNISVIYKRSKSSVVSQKKKNKVEKVYLNVQPTTQGPLQDNDDDDEEEEEEGWGGGGGRKEPEEQDWRE